MRTVKTLKPGQKGTKELLARFGPSLLNVRYRYEEDRREHVKTVGLVVQRRSREDSLECRGSRAHGGRGHDARTDGDWARDARTDGDRNRGGRIHDAWMRDARSERARNVESRRVALRIGWRERPAATGEFRWEPLGSGQASLDAAK